MNRLRGVDFRNTSLESIEDEFKNQCEIFLESMMGNVEKKMNELYASFSFLKKQGIVTLGSICSPYLWSIS